MMRRFALPVARAAALGTIAGPMALSLGSHAAAQRAPGTPPSFGCPAGSVLFDWDNRPWTAGMTNNTYQLDQIGSINFAIANPNGVFISNVTTGGQSPNRQTVVNGGFTGENSLLIVVDMPNRAARATTTITLPTVMRGAQFRLFDVDFLANQFTDLVTVEGRYRGQTVLPTLTNGSANFVNGNTATGDGGSANNSPAGNVIVTFGLSIDTIIISYGNADTAPANPTQQGISLHDLTLCRPTTNITTTKTNTLISDQQNGRTNPKYIPGATVEYCLLTRNTGDTPAQAVIASDPLPATMTYVPGSMLSGTSCANANTPEDDDAVGADESDPFGGSFSGSTVTGSAPSLPAFSDFALRFRATVN